MRESCACTDCENEIESTQFRHVMGSTVETKSRDRMMGIDLEELGVLVSGLLCGASFMGVGLIVLKAFF